MRLKVFSSIALGLLVFFLCSFHLQARQVILVLSEDDFKDAPVYGAEESVVPIDEDSGEWDEFGDSDQEREEELDRGSWRPILEPDSSSVIDDRDAAEYYPAVHKIMEASSHGDLKLMEEAVAEIESAAASRNPHAQSVMAFVYKMGLMRERSKAKSFLYHTFAAKGGNTQSKMALAYTYSRQNMYDEAVNLYSELAEKAVKSFLISDGSPVIEPIRIHSGTEENKKALRKFRGEEDEDFQILEYQAQKGNAGAMYKIGLFYYFGLRGLRRDHAKAFYWFSRSAEKKAPRAMELLAEIYVRGVGVEKNYTKAYEWLTFASKHLYSAYNGLGYLYVKGYGVDKNYTKAKEYFERSADNEDASGHYNLGVMYLKGIGVKKDLKHARRFFGIAAHAGQPKAFYQLAKMFHTGVGLKKNLVVATSLYKLVAERGPWSSLSRWALESYIKGDVSRAFLLYSRMAELGYEVAQSNSAWILDKYGEQSLCIGEVGFCTDTERHQRAHSLWLQASEQGNEHAALLIGDAYYYGRGTEKDYVRAVEAYMHAKSQSNAQAVFNLGYMHEHGQGLPIDLHLAKRYYDQALEIEPAAKLPVTLALASLWLRRNYADSFLVRVIDSLPDLFPKVEAWVEDVLMEEGNATILTLCACLLTVLYLRERQRRNVVAPVGDMPQQRQLNEQGGAIAN